MAKLKLNEWDIKVLKLMKKGLMAKEVSRNLKENGIKPSSQASIDNRVRELRAELKCSTLFQLAWKLTRRKLI